MPVKKLLGSLENASLGLCEGKLSMLSCDSTEYPHGAFSMILLRLDYMSHSVKTWYAAKTQLSATIVADPPHRCSSRITSTRTGGNQVSTQDTPPLSKYILKEI